MDRSALMYVCVLTVWSKSRSDQQSFLDQQAVSVCLLFSLSHLCVLPLQNGILLPGFL